MLPAPPRNIPWASRSPSLPGGEDVFTVICTTITQVAGCMRTPIQPVPECTRQDKSSKSLSSFSTRTYQLFNLETLSWFSCWSWTIFSPTRRCWLMKKRASKPFLSKFIAPTHLAASIMHALFCCKQQKILTGRYLYLFVAAAHGNHCDRPDTSHYWAKSHGCCCALVMTVMTFDLSLWNSVGSAPPSNKSHSLVGIKRARQL